MRVLKQNPQRKDPKGVVVRDEKGFLSLKVIREESAKPAEAPAVEAPVEEVQEEAPKKKRK
jgi:hypothetical protein